MAALLSLCVLPCPLIPFTDDPVYLDSAREERERVFTCSRIMTAMRTFIDCARFYDPFFDAGLMGANGVRGKKGQISTKYDRRLLDYSKEHTILGERT